MHPILCPGRHCNPGIPIRTLQLKHRFVFSALRFWSPLFIDAARSCTQIDTASPSDGPSTHRFQIEVRICRGVMEPCQIWITCEGMIIRQVFFQSSSSSWPVMQHGDCREGLGRKVVGARLAGRGCGGAKRELRGVLVPVCGQVVYRETDSVKLSHCTPFPLVPDSARSFSLWLDVASNKEEILVPLWPAHRGHREIYGVCLSRRECF